MQIRIRFQYDFFDYHDQLLYNALSAVQNGIIESELSAKPNLKLITFLYNNPQNKNRHLREILVKYIHHINPKVKKLKVELQHVAKNN